MSNMVISAYASKYYLYNYVKICVNNWGIKSWH